MTRYEMTQHDILTIRHLKTENQHEQLIKQNKLKTQQHKRKRSEAQNSNLDTNGPKAQQKIRQNSPDKMGRLQCHLFDYQDNSFSNNET